MRIVLVARRGVGALGHVSVFCDAVFLLSKSRAAGEEATAEHASPEFWYVFSCLSLAVYKLVVKTRQRDKMGQSQTMRRGDDGSLIAGVAPVAERHTAATGDVD